MEQTELLTLTRLWLYPRHLRTLFGHRLPLPISHRTLGWAALAFAPTWALLRLFGVGWEHVWLTLRFVVPAAATWWLVRVAEAGGRPRESARSWVRYGAWHVRAWLSRPRPVRGRSRARVGA